MLNDDFPFVENKKFKEKRTIIVELFAKELKAFDSMLLMFCMMLDMFKLNFQVIFLLKPSIKLILPKNKKELNRIFWVWGFT